MGIAEPWPVIQELIGHTLALGESPHNVAARLRSMEDMPAFLAAIGQHAVDAVVFGPNMLPHVSPGGQEILAFVQQHNASAPSVAQRIATIAVGTLAMDEPGLQAVDRRVGANNVVAGLTTALDDIQDMRGEPATTA